MSQERKFEILPQFQGSFNFPESFKDPKFQDWVSGLDRKSQIRLGVELAILEGEYSEHPRTLTDKVIEGIPAILERYLPKE